MAATLFLLILYLNGVPIEYMGHHDVRGQWQEMGLAGCLSMNRTLKRNGWRDSGTGTRYACERRRVWVELDAADRPKIIKLLDD